MGHVTGAIFNIHSKKSLIEPADMIVYLSPVRYSHDQLHAV